MFADVDRIAVVQRGALDAQIVDEGAVEAVQIFDNEARTFIKDTSVVIGDGKIVHGNIVVGRAANRDRPAADGHLSYGFTFEHEAEFGHFSFLPRSRWSPRVCAPRGAAKKANLLIRSRDESR